MKTSVIQSGFTVLELLVTITIGSILLAIAIPSFSTITQNNRRSSYVNEFVSALNFARGEAVTLRKNVVMCLSADPTASSPACSTSNNAWQSGWIVFIDNNGNGVFNSDDVVLLVHEPIRASRTTLCGNLQTYTFNKIGLSPSTSGTVTYCDSRGNAQGRAVVVSTVGRIRTDSSPSNCSRDETSFTCS